MKTKQKEIKTKLEFETFQNLLGSSYYLNQFKKENASCFNGDVSVRKFKVTIELIDEPKEVIFERIEKLWKECDNHHHYSPLKDEAKKFGYDLDNNTLGINKKK